jgi:tryptophanyl-tRNA synthetase
MSKSDASDYSRINLTDDAEAIALKIQKAKTDPHPLPDDPKGLEGRPEADNLLTIFAALCDITTAEAVRRFAGRPFSEFKKELVDLAVAVLGPINAEMRRLKADPGHVDAILRRNAERATEIAEPILKKTQEIVGFLKD